MTSYTSLGVSKAFTTVHAFVLFVVEPVLLLLLLARPWRDDPYAFVGASA
jgi:hypothetical protein